MCNIANKKKLKTESIYFNSNSAKIASMLMKSKTSRFFHDHVLVKEPGSSIVTPWHQDQPYYCVKGEQSVSFWIPLDNIGFETSHIFVFLVRDRSHIPPSL